MCSLVVHTIARVLFCLTSKFLYSHGTGGLQDPFGCLEVQDQIKPKLRKIQKPLHCLRRSQNLRIRTSPGCPVPSHRHTIPWALLWGLLKLRLSWCENFQFMCTTSCGNIVKRWTAHARAFTLKSVQFRAEKAEAGGGETLRCLRLSCHGQHECQACHSPSFPWWPFTLPAPHSANPFWLSACPFSHFPWLLLLWNSPLGAESAWKGLLLMGLWCDCCSHSAHAWLRVIERVGVPQEVHGCQAVRDEK